MSSGSRSAVLLAIFLCAIGCAPDEAAQNNNTVESTVSAPNPSREITQIPQSDDLSEAAAATLSEIRSLIETGSLRQLARFADRQRGFTSNFGTDSHFDYWYLLRRTGVEPLSQLTTILDQPHGDILVGNKRWHIWPDFAALPENARSPDEMSLSDRTRLFSLVGEQAANGMKDGLPYPGVRTAISEDGRWIYWLFDTGEDD